MPPDFSTQSSVFYGQRRIMGTVKKAFFFHHGLKFMNREENVARQLRNWKRTAFYLRLVMNQCRSLLLLFPEAAGLRSRLALWLHTQKLLIVPPKHNVMFYKIQGKHMQLPSPVQRLSREEEKTVRWRPLIKTLLPVFEDESQMK